MLSSLKKLNSKGVSGGRLPPTPVMRPNHAGVKTWVEVLTDDPPPDNPPVPRAPKIRPMPTPNCGTLDLSPLTLNDPIVPLDRSITVLTSWRFSCSSFCASPVTFFCWSMGVPGLDCDGYPRDCYPWGALYERVHSPVLLIECTPNIIQPGLGSHMSAEFTKPQKHEPEEERKSTVTSNVVKSTRTQQRLRAKVTAAGAQPTRRQGQARTRASTTRTKHNKPQRQTTTKASATTIESVKPQWSIRAGAAESVVKSTNHQPHIRTDVSATAMGHLSLDPIKSEQHIETRASTAVVGFANPQVHTRPKVTSTVIRKRGFDPITGLRRKETNQERAERRRRNGGRNRSGRKEKGNDRQEK